MWEKESTTIVGEEELVPEEAKVIAAKEEGKGKTA
jgi:hypothetical protein